MSKGPTHGERLAAIETLMTAHAEAISKNGIGVEKVLDRIDALDERWTKRFDIVQDEVDELNALKSKGSGVLVGIGLIVSAITTWASGAFHKIQGMFAG